MKHGENVVVAGCDFEVDVANKKESESKKTKQRAKKSLWFRKSTHTQTTPLFSLHIKINIAKTP